MSKCETCGLEDTHHDCFYALAERLAKVEAKPDVGAWIEDVERRVYELEAQMTLPTSNALASAEGRPVCKDWCGTGQAPMEETVWCEETWCSRECAKACRPLNPAQDHRSDDGMTTWGDVEPSDAGKTCQCGWCAACAVRYNGPAPSEPAKAPLSEPPGIRLEQHSRRFGQVADLEARLARVNRCSECSGTNGVAPFCDDCYCRDIEAERARVNGWWLAYHRLTITYVEAQQGIASGAPVPGGTT